MIFHVFLQTFVEICTPQALWSSPFWRRRVGSCALALVCKRPPPAFAKQAAAGKIRTCTKLRIFLTDSWWKRIFLNSNSGEQHSFCLVDYDFILSIKCICNLGFFCKVHSFNFRHDWHVFNFIESLQHEQRATTHSSNPTYRILSLGTSWRDQWLWDISVLKRTCGWWMCLFCKLVSWDLCIQTILFKKSKTCNFKAFCWSSLDERRK